MGFPILVRRYIYIESGPRALGFVSFIFRELSNMFSALGTRANFSGKFSPQMWFLALYILAKLFWKARETLMKGSHHNSTSGHVFIPYAFYHFIQWCLANFIDYKDFIRLFIEEKSNTLCQNIINHFLCWREDNSMMTSWYESAFHITGPLGGTQLVTIMLSYVLTPRLPGSKLRDDLNKTPLKSCQEHTEVAYRKSY